MGIEIVFANIPSPLRQSKLATDLDDIIPHERVFSQVTEALAVFLAREDLSKE